MRQFATMQQLYCTPLQGIFGLTDDELYWSRYFAFFVWIRSSEQILKVSGDKINNTSCLWMFSRTEVGCWYFIFQDATFGLMHVGQDNDITSHKPHYKVAIKIPQMFHLLSVWFYIAYLEAIRFSTIFMSMQEKYLLS